jgi:hypothetical protein
MILNTNTKHQIDAGPVHSLIQHMKLPLRQFRIHGDDSAKFVEVQLDWNVFTTQLAVGTWNVLPLTRLEKAQCPYEK